MPLVRGRHPCFVTCEWDPPCHCGIMPFDPSVWDLYFLKVVSRTGWDLNLLDWFKATLQTLKFKTPLRKERLNLFWFILWGHIFCQIPPCVSEAVELVWTCPTGPAQLSHSLELPTTNTLLLLHNHRLNACKILLVPAKDPLSVQLLGDLRLRVVILLLTNLENKTIHQQLLLSSATSRSASLPTRKALGWKGKSWTSTITSCPRTGRTSKRGCCFTVLSQSTLVCRYGYGGWVSLDHTCGGCPKPGKANMMKVMANIILVLFFSLIINVFRMEISSGPWRRTVGALRYCLHLLQCWLNNSEVNHRRDGRDEI